MITMHTIIEFILIHNLIHKVVIMVSDGVVI